MKSTILRILKTVLIFSVSWILVGVFTGQDPTTHMNVVLRGEPGFLEYFGLVLYCLLVALGVFLFDKEPKKTEE